MSFALMNPDDHRQVIGATFSKELLLHMLPNNSRDRTENLHAALLKLIEANFISRSVVGRTEHFSFVHNSVQEVSACGRGTHVEVKVLPVGVTISAFEYNRRLFAARITAAE